MGGPRSVAKCGVQHILDLWEKSSVPVGHSTHLIHAMAENALFLAKSAANNIPDDKAICE